MTSCTSRRCRRANPIGLDRGAPRAYAHRHLRPHRSEGPDDGSNYRFRALSNDRSGAARGGRLVRAVGDLVVQSRGERRDIRPRRCHRLFSQRSARRDALVAQRAAGELHARQEPQRDLPAAHESLSAQHRSRGRADVPDQRSAGELRQRRHADARQRDRSRASLARRSCRRPATRRGAPIRASASSASTSSTTPARSPGRSRSSGSRGIVW